MKIELNICPFCKGIAERYIKTVESFRKIHNYYVACTECGASTDRYNTEFAMLLNGKFHVLTHNEAIRKSVNDWNNGVFDTPTRLLHMTEQEKILWYTEDLLKVAWYGANVLVGSSRWETAWKLRKIAEEQKLLKISTENDLREVARVLLNNCRVRPIVCKYLEEIGEL
ncbi:MAG: hypothetical protein HDQ99_05670 [Lachnospiraceae bacterium]|nr:hypothetical protein [Lachnospiraceae bacterium]